MKEKLHSLQHCRAPLKEIEQALKDRKMTTGQLAFLALSSILQHPDFPESLIEKFQTYKFSNQVFGVCYPLLIRRRDWTKSAQYYYSDYLKCKGKLYCLTNTWTTANRGKLKTWIRENMIDIDDHRSNWVSNKNSSKQKKKSIQVADGTQFNGLKIKRVQSLSPNNKLIINCDILQTYNGDKKLKEIAITKRYLAIIKNKNHECAFQVRVHNQIFVFKISAKILYKTFVERFDNFSDGLHDQFWHFRINIKNAKICSAIGGQDIEFVRCNVYELKEELPSTPLGDYTQIPGMNLCVSKAES